METADQIESTKLREIGNQHYVKGEFTEAEDLYTQALHFDQNDCKIFANRSAARAKLEAWNDALSDAQKSTELNPEYIKGWFRQAEALKALLRWSEAADAYISCLELEPDVPEAVQGVGFTVVQDFLEKMPYSECKETASSREEKWNMITDTYEKSPQEAIRFFQETLQIFNTHKQQGLHYAILMYLGKCFALLDCKHDTKRCYQASRAFQHSDDLEDVSSQFSIYYTLAHLYASIRQMKPATVYLNRAYAIARTWDDPDTKATMLMLQRALFMHDSESKEVIDEISQALELRERNGLPVDVDVLRRMAVALREIGNNTKSMQYDMWADDIPRDLKDPEPVSDSEQAAMLREIGGQHFIKGEFKQAEDLYTQALQFDQNDCKIFANRSAARAKLGTWNDALSDAQKSTELNPEYIKGWFRQAEALKALHRWSEAADAYIRYLELEPDLPEAIQGVGFTVVQDLLEKMPYSECKETWSSATEKFNMVTNTYEMHPEVSIRFYKEALQIFNVYGFQSQYDVVLRNLGSCFGLQGYHDDHLRCRHASRTFTASNKTMGERFNIYYTLAELYVCIGRTKPARVYFDKTVAIASEHNDPDTESEKLTLQGRLLIKETKYAKAIDVLSQAIELRQQNGLRVDADMFMYIAKAQQEIGNNMMEKQYEVKAIDVDCDSEDPKSRAVAFGRLGFAYAKAHKWSEAEQLFREAIEIDPSQDNMLSQKVYLAISKDMEANYSKEQEKELLQNALAYFREAQDIAKSKRDKSYALFLQERIGTILVRLARLENQSYAEARSVLKSAIEFGRKLEAKDNEMVKILYEYATCLLRENDQVMYAIELLQEAQTMLSNVLSNLTGDRMMILWESRNFFTDINDRLIAAYFMTGNHRNILETIEYNKSPALLQQLSKKTGTNVKMLRFDEIIQEAHIRKSVFVFYIHDDDTVMILFITPDRAEVQFLCLARSPIDMQETVNTLSYTPSISSFLEFIDRDAKNLDISESSGENISEDKLKKYYDFFWKPLSSILQKYKETSIYIFPEGKQWNIPFAAFIYQDSYLIDHHTIVLAPSVGVLKKLTQNNKAHQHPSEVKALVIGNPAVPNIAGMSSLSSLPDAEQEAIDVAELLEDTGYYDVKVFCGVEARKAEVVDLLKKSTIAHIATHGFLRSPSQAESYLPGGLVLASSGEKQDTEENCLLLAEEIQELSLGDLKLAVLSCCHTGRGDVNAEGLMGLGRAFLFAGCQCVLLSRWSISDSATRTFMNVFYKHFNIDNANAATALRSAMLFMKSEGYSVRDWAAFYVLGNGGLSLY